MTTQSLKVYEPAMCCSTGVCGPDVDTQLVQFASDLEWIKAQGVALHRFNLAQNPNAFVEEALVSKMLSEKGEDVLPVILLNGQVAFHSRYPDRSELADILNLNTDASSSNDSSSCCDDSTCCS